MSDQPKPGDPFVTTKRVTLSFTVSPDDLDILRNTFGQVDDECEEKPFARRIMKAVHRARRKLGFEWVH